jgi:RimJ/RimL family protein N-acetyltransferase
MIRQANKFDKQDIIEMIRLFGDESPFDEYKKLRLFDSENETNKSRTIENVEYINQMIDAIIAGKGVIFIEPNKGFIMGIITSNIWSDKIYSMQELAWFVKKEHRNTSIGYRLLKSYIDYSKELKQQGRINFFTISKTINSPNLKYEKFGFNKIEESWVGYD